MLEALQHSRGEGSESLTTGTGGVAAARGRARRWRAFYRSRSKIISPSFPPFFLFFFLFRFFSFFACNHRPWPQATDLLLLLAAVRMVYAVTAVLARTLLAQNIANGPRTSSVRVNIVKSLSLSFSLFHFLFVPRSV